MNSLPTIARRFAFAPVALAASLMAAGCVSLPSKSTLEAVRAQQNPADTARRTVTNFTPALRCMDELMYANGTRDITLMMEEMRDATQRVPISARDMMTSAISEMTRRSRAVRLSVFGSDQGNLMQVLQLAQKTQAFAVVPEFNLRGTVSQFDEDVQRQSASLGAAVAERFGLRLGSDSRFSVLGFDAALVRTENLTLVPGVNSKNTTVIAKRNASAGDGQARIMGAGTVFSFDASRAEGNAQAARNMIELAAVELVGKLIRAPYWQCLGVADNQPEVQREIEDWFHSMDDGERIAFVKARLRERRWFDGAIDAQATPEFAQALAQQRRLLGLNADGALDDEFFRRFVTTKAQTGPLTIARNSSAATAAAASAPAREGDKPKVVDNTPPAPPARVFTQVVKPGEAQVQVIAASAGYLFCFAQDPSSAIRRIFPNRFTRDARVEPGASVMLPGPGRFSLDDKQRIACVHSERDIYNELPPSLRWGDFDEVRLKSFDEIGKAFTQVAGKGVALLPAQSVPR